MTGLLVASLGAIATLFILYGLLQTRWSQRFVDRPNKRSLHEKPTPRIGGLAIVSVMLIGVSLIVGLSSDISPTKPPYTALLVACVCGLAILGMFDDRLGLSATLRALIHTLIAAGFVVGLIATSSLAVGVLTGIIATLALAWSANLFNFMDGSDGLIGLSASIGFTTLAWLAPSGSLVNLGAAILAGSCAGFLIFNWQPAKIFLGDAGSVPIGFAAAALGLIGIFREYWQWWMPIACFLPLIFDATVTLTHRLLRGKKPWHAHREHSYQRLILSGWSHQRVAVFYGNLSLICCLVVATTRYQYGYVSFALWTVIILIQTGIFLIALRISPHVARR